VPPEHKNYCAKEIEADVEFSFSEAQPSRLWRS
jgi:hypothetical protein